MTTATAAHGFTDGVPDDQPSPWRLPADAPAVARVGTSAGVRTFAVAGGDLDAKVHGRTPLHHAAWRGDVELVAVLLDAGADPQVLDDDHVATPLGWAERACAPAPADLLRPLTL